MKAATQSIGISDHALDSCRLLVERLDISGIQLLFDLHLSQQIGSSIPLDTHAAPLGLAPVSVCCVLFRPTVLAHGLLAHFVAEALLSAPQMLGSLELLLNPTGAWLTLYAW